MTTRTAICCALLVACAPEPSTITSSVEEHLAGAGFSGAALVVHDGVELVRTGFGFADVELRVPNSPELIYGIGSLTKPINASAVLAAVADGHLTLTQSVCEFMPDCPAEWVGAEVRHLLDHTSGIPDLFGALPEAPLLETTREVDALVSGASIPLTSAPGSQYSYSNFNYVLLGYIIRAATGKDWERYTIDRILAPIGALDTRYDDVWAIVAGKARGYGMTGGELRKIAYEDHSAYAAGGLLSTLDDLRVWQASLEAGRLIPQSALEASFTPNAGGYGYGWQVISALGRELRNHTGGVDGYASHLAWYPTDHLLVILLSNVAGTPVKALACDVARIVLTVPPLPTSSKEWLEGGTAERCDQRPL